MMISAFFPTIRLAVFRWWLTVAYIRRMMSLLVLLGLLRLLVVFPLVLVDLVILIEFVWLVDQHCLFHWGSSRISNRNDVIVFSFCAQVGHTIFSRHLHSHSLTFLAGSGCHRRLLLNDSTGSYILFLRSTVKLGLLLMQYFAFLQFRLARWLYWTVARSRIAC